MQQAETNAGKTVLKRATALIMAALLGVTQIAIGVASAQVTDSEAPVVIHRQAESAGVAGELQTFLARVSDDFEIARVTLFYRQSPEGAYQQIPMRSLLDSIGEYMIAIETDISEYPGLQYYIEAEDTAGNTASRGYDYAPIVLPLETPAATPASVAQAPVASEPAASGEAPKISNTGLLMGLGALLLLGALAGGGGGSSEGGGTTPPPTGDTVTLTIISDGPTGN